jgi:putative phosphoesterase
VKVGLVSDTHDRVGLSVVAAEFLRDEGCDAVFHLGDITTPEGAAPFVGLPVTFVRGNNDHSPGLDGGMRTLGLAPPVDSWQGDLRGVRLGATHGDVGGTLRSLVEACDVVLRGHSHIAGVARVGRALVVNPGALHRASVKSVALLDLPSRRVDFFEVRPEGVAPWAP